MCTSYAIEKSVQNHMLLWYTQNKAIHRHLGFQPKQSDWTSHVHDTDS